MPGAGNAFYNHFVEFLRQTRYLLIHSLCFPVRCLSGAIPVIGGKSFAEIVAMLGIMAGIAYLAKGLTRNECGHLADYLSVVMISFSFRKVSLWSYFGIGFDRAIFWHKFVATITMAVMLKHAVTHILHGELSITGLIMCALLIIQCSVYFIFNFNNRNAVTKSCYNFNYFYFTHVSVYLILIPILAIHGAYFFAGIGVLWGLDLSIRYYFDCVSTTATVKLLTKDLIRVEIPNKFPRLRPGQYCFLNFPKISRFEYHPFAIGGTENDSVITFFVKIVGDWTGKLKDLHVGVAGLEPIEEEVCEPPKATDIEAGKSLSRSSSMEEKSPSPGIRRSPGLATDVEAFTSIDYDEVSTPPKAAASKVINVKRSDISPPTNDELEDIEDEEGYYNNSTLYHSSVMGGNPDTDLEMGGIIHAPLTSKPQGNNASKKIFSINNPGNKGSPTGSGNNSHTGSDKDMNKRLRSSPNTTTASNTTTTATVTAVTSKQSLTSSQPTDNSEKTTERSTTTTTAAAKKTASKCRTCGMRKDNDCDITQVDIRIEGPYGSLSYDLMDANTYPVLLLIGGGIGIVPKFGLLRNVITKYRYGRSPTLKKVVIVWCFKDDELAKALFLEFFEKLFCRNFGRTDYGQTYLKLNDESKNGPKFEFYFHHTKPLIYEGEGDHTDYAYVSRLNNSELWFNGRPNWNGYYTSAAASVEVDGFGLPQGRVGVDVCGPMSLIQEVRSRNNYFTRSTGISFDLHEECLKL